MRDTSDFDKRRLRRTLLRGGLSAAPVLLTLPSGPAMATLGTGTGHTASAHASIKAGVLASANASGPSCTGKGPYYWCSNTGTWPSACQPGNNHQQNTVSSNCYKRYSSTWCATKSHVKAQYGLCSPARLSTSEQTAAASQPNVTKLAAYLSASMLNFHSGRVPSTVTNLTELQAIWDSFLTSGSWSPATGVVWGHADVFDWLESTWIAM